MTVAEQSGSDFPVKPAPRRLQLVPSLPLVPPAASSPPDRAEMLSEMLVEKCLEPMLQHKGDLHSAVALWLETQDVLFALLKLIKDTVENSEVELSGDEVVTDRIVDNARTFGGEAWEDLVRAGFRNMIRARRIVARLGDQASVLLSSESFIFSSRGHVWGRLLLSFLASRGLQDSDIGPGVRNLLRRALDNAPRTLFVTARTVEVELSSEPADVAVGSPSGFEAQHLAFAKRQIASAISHT